MKFKDLRSFLAGLEAAGELTRINEELSPQHELAAAIKMISRKEGKAVLLGNIRGYDIPVVGNLLGNTIALILLTLTHSGQTRVGRKGIELSDQNASSIVPRSLVVSK